MIPSFDELNNLRIDLESRKVTDENGRVYIDKNDAEDSVLDLLVMAYIYGNEDANLSLDDDIYLTRDDAHASIYKKIAGKTFADRVREYAETGDVESIIKVADTEVTRNYNEAVQKTGNIFARGGHIVHKMWLTKEDDRVRDTHSYLHGTQVPLAEKFFTYDGDSALYPGGFDKAENNVNCRCTIKLSKQ